MQGDCAFVIQAPTSEKISQRHVFSILNNVLQKTKNRSHETFKDAQVAELTYDHRGKKINESLLSIKYRNQCIRDKLSASNPSEQRGPQNSNKDIGNQLDWLIEGSFLH